MIKYILLSIFLTTGITSYQLLNFDDEWIYLFDGSTTEGWRAYNGNSLPKKWTIQDDVLTFSTDSKLEKDLEGGGDIIYYVEEWQKAGADYAMYSPNKNKILNPAEQWNSSKIVFTTNKVEHWLNGEMILSFVPWSEDWYKRKNKSKWKNAEKYGSFKKGYIGLQDHDSPLWFRNIKIRKL